MHKVGTTFIHDLNREYWASGNFDTVVGKDGACVDLIDLKKFQIKDSLILDFKERLDDSTGFLLTMYRGLSFDTNSVVGKLTDLKVEDNKLRGWVTPHGRLGRRATELSKESGYPIIFLGKFKDIRQPDSLTEIVGFRVDFTINRNATLR